MNDQLTVDAIVRDQRRLLQELHRRQSVVRDYVRAVARQYAAGFYLYGPPGTAKTHTVRSVLENEVRDIYAYQRGHVTPLGLFEVLKDHRDEVTVLDYVSH